MAVHDCKLFEIEKRILEEVKVSTPLREQADGQTHLGKYALPWLPVANMSAIPA
jgi:hypothetical protein